LSTLVCDADFPDVEAFFMRERRGIAGLAVALIVTLVVTVAALTGCSGSSGGGSAASGDGGIADKSPATILRLARAAVFAAGSYHVATVGSTFAGQSFDLDVHVNDKAQTAEGDAKVKGADVKFVKVGGAIYVNAPASFYRQIGVQPAQIALAGDHWVKAPINDPTFSSFISFASTGSYLSPTTKVTKGDTTTVDGYPVVTIASDNGKVFIRTKGAPYPVQLESTQQGSGAVTFDDFGQPVHVTAPKKWVDVAEVQAVGH
jgi:hypothetical protein